MSYVLFAEEIPYFAELPPPLLLGFEVGIGVGVGSSDSIPVTCLLYTSDAADEEDSVDLGGRRIIQKKNTGTCKVKGNIYNNKREQV